VAVGLVFMWNLSHSFDGRVTCEDGHRAPA